MAPYTNLASGTIKSPTNGPNSLEPGRASAGVRLETSCRSSMGTDCLAGLLLHVSWQIVRRVVDVHKGSVDDRDRLEDVLQAFTVVLRQLSGIRADRTVARVRIGLTSSRGCP